MYPRLYVRVPRSALARALAWAVCSAVFAMPVAGMAADVSLQEAARIAVDRAPVLDPAAPATAVQTASATGVVESIDLAAKKVTIAHGAVEALKWPAMTMSFHAPEIDLTTLKPGDRVTFEFTSSGMDGTITRIERQP